ncbi:MAG: ribonuclease J 1 [Candidatus Parcubacteria bacterium]|nr:MAG: ribonuclease J 1 [Candidatus Parcubacteria bacterium]
MNSKINVEQKILIKRNPKKIKKETVNGSLKIIPLGGLEEVGRNMTVFEWCPDKGREQIVILDAGLGYPESENMLGVDYIIPNIEYLEEKKDKILGILITHGHYDHIGAIPYIIDKLNYPPIYTTPLTKGLIIKRQEDFPRLQKLEIYEIKKENYTPFKLGDFMIDYFHVNHNIPDSIGFFIKTPIGNILHTGDFKIDFTPFFDKPADLSRIVKLSHEGVDLLMIDSTNAPESGHIISERKIMENLEEVFKKAKGRIIASTFASLLERIQQLIYLAGLYGRRVVIDGHTMRINVEVAKRLGYLKYNKGIFIRPEESFKLPPHRVLIICTGSQAEEGSALMRIANKEHRYFKIINNDSVIFSSSVIPGNERIIQNLKDILTKQGAKIFHYQMMDIHASGHAFADDIRLFINLSKPNYIMPVHGHYFMMKAIEEIGIDLGIPKEKIIIASNGQVVKMFNDKIELTDEKIPANLVYVDGLGLGSVGDLVLRDRKALAEEGMFVIIITLNSQTGEIKTSPDIISRGFVFLKESKDLLNEVRTLAKNIVIKNTKHLGDEAPIIQEEQIKYSLKEEISQFLYRKTQRRPVVIPVIIKV